MDKYGDASVRAAKLLSIGTFATPREAWDSAVLEIFPDRLPSRIKGCPRAAFLSLCQLGVIRGVIKGNYTRSVRNRDDVAGALDELIRSPELAEDKLRLWALATGNIGKAHNSQMDVVISLFHAGYLDIRS